MKSMVHAGTKQSFTSSLKSTKMWKANTSTDEGNKPERVYKYNNQASLSDSEDSNEAIVTPPITH
jgi:hypothetical protein